MADRTRGGRPEPGPDPGGAAAGALQDEVPLEAGAPVTLQESRHAVAVAAGRAPADVALCGARILNVFTGTFEPGELLLAGRIIAAVVGEGQAAVDRPPPRETVTLPGGLLAPGLIDAHMHLESSLVTPGAYAEAVVPRGVTGVVCDPHEIANVAGVAGVRWLLERGGDLPLDVWLTVSSCVPSTSLETPGAALDPGAMVELLDDPRAVGLGELMSFPEVIAGAAEQLRKPLLAEARRKTVEGHAPGVAGPELQAYLAAGATSDHEASGLEEGREKLRHGMLLMVREGSVARDARSLAPLVHRDWGERIAFCSDDVLPHDLLRDGGVDHAVRVAVAHGADLATALKAASWNAARHYRLPRRGALTAGYLADLVWLDRPEEVAVGRVWKEGGLVARDGRLLVERTPKTDGDGAVRHSIRLPPLDARLLRLPADGGSLRVIDVRPNSLVTGAAHAQPTLRDGAAVADPERDLAKLICVERHGRGGRVAVALARGFGLSRGALASSVGHDHHNLMAVGVDDDDLIRACRRLEALGGGFVALERGEVRAELPLPLGGLLTDAPLVEVRQGLDGLDDAARELGCSLPSPFMALSFLGLAVIPELKLTDHGLVDVLAGRLVPPTFAD